jgi:sugar phosphate isomerase/epimerase
MPTVSFISANYVARVLKYSGESNWGVHDNATVAATDRAHFEGILADVKAAGFSAIDIWMAHCHFNRHSPQHRESIKDACAKAGMAVTSYAGGIGGTKQELDTIFRFMRDLGAPILAGGYFGKMPAAEAMPAVHEICQRYSVRYALENHPEKSADEIWTRIGQGQYSTIGVALDTGWCGTQDFDALDAVKRFVDKGKLFILHLKDVTQKGGHGTCALGDGVIPCEKIVRHIKQAKWEGTICIEHEPYDRDPMPEVKTSLDRVKKWLA